MALVRAVRRGGRAVRRGHGGPSIRPRAPVSQPAAGVSQGEPRRHSCRARRRETRPIVRRSPGGAQQKFRTAARPSVRRLGPIHSRRAVPKKVNVASSFSPSPGALVSRPGAADPRAGSGSQFPAVLRVESKFMFAFSSVWDAVSRVAEPKSRRCNGPGATDGQHGRCRTKAFPQIGSQHMRQGYTHSPAAGPAAPPAVARARHTTLR